MPGPASERATLSRDLADFLIELSIALHKHAMYPEGHPSLAPAAAGVTRRAERLLQDRSTLSLGVARQQLVIRSEERRVGKECRSRWWQCRGKKIELRRHGLLCRPTWCRLLCETCR